MKMFTRAELDDLRRAAVADRGAVLRNPEILDRLIGQAQYALECAALLDEAVHYPAEPYGEAEKLVSRLTDGVNEIWNRFRYRDGGGGRARS